MNKLVTILLLISPLLYGQQNDSVLPNGYRSIILGSSIDEVKKALEEDSYFRYQGEPDVTMLEDPDRTSIEVSGAGFIKSAYFLFYQEQLYNIILEMRRDRLDYSTIYQSLVDKYGEVSDLDPVTSYWENDAIKLSLERPLFIKYLDKALFNQLQTQSKITESYRSMARDQFLQNY